LLNPDFKDMLSAFCDQQVEFLIVGGYAPWQRTGTYVPLAISTCGFAVPLKTLSASGALCCNSEHR